MAVGLSEINMAPNGFPDKHMHSRPHSCPNCGSEVALEQSIAEAQRKIAELEAQVEMLKDKATAAVDKCADYEDQLRSMRASQPPPNPLIRTNTSESLHPSRPSTDEARPSTANSASGRQSRFSFLTGRRGSPANSQSHLLPGHSPSHSLSPAPPTDAELLEQLERERALRAEAEEKARKVDSEIEELSVHLFTQANEMVAAEKKARAKLEARVEQLEKRDREKMARLDRLEKAVTRVERVKAMLRPGSG
ncbi:hypothetical protein M011DRAFT_468882 [Sporormia fimetaria CBS 119925]|uniref:GDP/GTP exchange factor Sec2 N-terminal domain-containing protein n=1 Tax=Sporormia fimetaria CBS 119925 TaxID=1340428 RepID=A0A6A6V8J6_9PLEO|nr:hypothetical protein M011DRAFT_468882 [Sporormia fimetaria CBS 119925]